MKNNGILWSLTQNWKVGFESYSCVVRMLNYNKRGFCEYTTMTLPLVLKLPPHYYNQPPVSQVFPIQPTSHPKQYFWPKDAEGLLSTLFCAIFCKELQHPGILVCAGGPETDAHGLQEMTVLLYDTTTNSNNESVTKCSR